VAPLINTCSEQYMFCNCARPVRVKSPRNEKSLNLDIDLFVVVNVPSIYVLDVPAPISAEPSSNTTFSVYVPSDTYMATPLVATAVASAIVLYGYSCEPFAK